MRVLAFVALLGILAGAGYAASVRISMHQREQGAIDAVTAVVEAQRRFHAAGGHGAYATSLESLTRACPDGTAPVATQDAVEARGYTISLEARDDAPRDTVSGADCHGRPTTPDYIVAAEPVRVGVDGLRAASATAAGRIFLFFDGVAPRAADMGPGGLAMPLDDLRPIP